MGRFFGRRLAAAIAAGLLLSCSNPSATPPKSDNEPRRSLTAGEMKLATTSETFGLQLFRQSATEWPNQNTVVSPLSVAMALAMTYNGAAGTTREAMQQTLQLYGMTDQGINESFGNLIGLLTHLDDRVSSSIANSIWFRQGFPVNDSFLNLNREYFGAKAAELDFSQGDAADLINAWVAEQTHGKIAAIVEPPLDPQLMMLLVNAIYFKGIWTHQFDTTATHDRAFTTVDNTQIMVPFMKLDADLGFVQNDQYKAVELPYGSGDYSMIVILPEPDVTVDSMIGLLSAESFKQLVNGLHSSPGHLFLPRFKVTCDLTLNQVLTDLGMGVAFQPSQADFSNISEAGDLHLSEVIHKTYIAVDEQGTEAAAVTGVGIRLTSIAPNEFTLTVDRPFLFAIRESTTGSLLFLGRIVNPSEN